MIVARITCCLLLLLVLLLIPAEKAKANTINIFGLNHTSVGQANLSVLVDGPPSCSSLISGLAAMMAFASIFRPI
jgi:hypothetical protein